MRKLRIKAITLMEIMVTLIIVSILASLALPQFLGTRERSLSKEARANLKLIDAAEKIYRMEAGFYYPFLAAPPVTRSEINTNLKTAIGEGSWAYNITGNNGQSYSSTADRQGSGGYLDCTYSMTDSTTGGEPTHNAYCP